MDSSFPNPPVFQPCGSSTPPILPQKFHAVALLTPFNNTQLVIADITYDWSQQAMRVTTYGLEQGYADLLYTGGQYYILDSENGGQPKQRFGPIQTSEQVPAPDWLVQIGAICNGSQEVLGVNTNWWCKVTPNLNPSAPFPSDPTSHPSANWFWLRADTLYPWRMMLINTNNEFNLPFLGRFAIVHFPTFEPVDETNLPSIIQQCKAKSKKVDRKYAAALRMQTMEDTYNLLKEKPFLSRGINRRKLLNKVQELIPGLTPPTGSETPPSWPDKLYMTALTTPTFEVTPPNTPPIPNQPYPTQVFYDWTIPGQLSRFLTPVPGMPTLDLILTDMMTYAVARLPGNVHKCIPQLNVDHVGVVRQQWTTDDGAVCRGVITNNPQLSPGKTTQIFTLPSMPPRLFWIWYDTQDSAIMFAEVPQACNVKFVLTDYFDYIPSPPPFDPSLFVVPPDCLFVPLEPPQKAVAIQPIVPAKSQARKKTVASKSLHKKGAVARTGGKVKTPKTSKKTAALKTGKKTTVRKLVKKTAVVKAARKTVARKPARKKKVAQAS